MSARDLAIAAIVIFAFAAAGVFAAAAHLAHTRAEANAAEIRRLREINRNLRLRDAQLADLDRPDAPLYNPDDPLEVQLDMPAYVPEHERRRGDK